MRLDDVQQCFEDVERGGMEACCFLRLVLLQGIWPWNNQGEIKLILWQGFGCCHSVVMALNDSITARRGKTLSAEWLIFRRLR